MLTTPNSRICCCTHNKFPALAIIMLVEEQFNLRINGGGEWSFSQQHGVEKISNTLEYQNFIFR